MSAAPFLLVRMQRHIHPKPTGHAAMRLAQNTASSMGPALYASANTAIQILPPRNKSNRQRRFLKRAAIVPLRWPDCFRSSTPPKSLAWLACCVAVLTCGDDPSRDNSVVWLALGCCPRSASDQRFNIGVHRRIKAGLRQFSQCSLSCAASLAADES